MIFCREFMCPIFFPSKVDGEKCEPHSPSQKKARHWCTSFHIILAKDYIFDDVHLGKNHEKSYFPQASRCHLLQGGVSVWWLLFVVAAPSSHGPPLGSPQQAGPPVYFHGYRRGRELGRGASGQVLCAWQLQANQEGLKDNLSKPIKVVLSWLICWSNVADWFHHSRFKVHKARWGNDGECI